MQPRPNPSLNADVPRSGLRPGSGPPVSLRSLGIRRGKRAFGDKVTCNPDEFEALSEDV
jgi:hypothetical protein